MPNVRRLRKMWMMTAIPSQKIRATAMMQMQPSIRVQKISAAMKLIRTVTVQMPNVRRFPKMWMMTAIRSPKIRATAMMRMQPSIRVQKIFAATALIRTVTVLTRYVRRIPTMWTMTAIPSPKIRATAMTRIPQCIPARLKSAATVRIRTVTAPI